MYDSSKKKKKTWSQEFFKSAWHHSVNAGNTTCFMPWQLRDRLGVYHWPLQLLKEIFIKFKVFFLFSDIFCQKLPANLDGVISQNNKTGILMIMDTKIHSIGF